MSDLILQGFNVVNVLVFIFQDGFEDLPGREIADIPRHLLS